MKKKEKQNTYHAESIEPVGTYAKRSDRNCKKITHEQKIDALLFQIDVSVQFMKKLNTITEFDTFYAEHQIFNNAIEEFLKYCKYILEHYNSTKNLGDQAFVKVTAVRDAQKTFSIAITNIRLTRQSIFMKHINKHIHEMLRIVDTYGTKLKGDKYFATIIYPFAQKIKGLLLTIEAKLQRILAPLIFEEVPSKKTLLLAEKIRDINRMIIMDYKPSLSKYPSTEFSSQEFFEDWAKNYTVIVPLITAVPTFNERVKIIEQAIPPLNTHLEKFCEEFRSRMSVLAGPRAVSFSTLQNTSIRSSFNMAPKSINTLDDSQELAQIDHKIKENDDQLTIQKLKYQNQIERINKLEKQIKLLEQENSDLKEKLRMSKFERKPLDEDKVKERVFHLQQAFSNKDEYKQIADKLASFVRDKSILESPDFPTTARDRIPLLMDYIESEVRKANESVSNTEKEQIIKRDSKTAKDELLHAKIVSTLIRCGCRESGIRELPNEVLLDKIVHQRTERDEKQLQRIKRGIEKCLSEVSPNSNSNYSIMSIDDMLEELPKMIRLSKEKKGVSEEDTIVELLVHLTGERKPKFANKKLNELSEIAIKASDDLIANKIDSAQLAFNEFANILPEHIKPIECVPYIKEVFRKNKNTEKSLSELSAYFTKLIDEANSDNCRPTSTDFDGFIEIVGQMNQCVAQIVPKDANEASHSFALKAVSLVTRLCVALSSAFFSESDADSVRRAEQLLRANAELEQQNERLRMLLEEKSSLLDQEVSKLVESEKAFSRFAAAMKEEFERRLIEMRDKNEGSSSDSSYSGD